MGTFFLYQGADHKWSLKFKAKLVALTQYSSERVFGVSVCRFRRGKVRARSNRHAELLAFAGDDPIGMIFVRLLWLWLLSLAFSALNAK